MHNLISRDLQNVWHPCSQMHDYETHPPLAVVGAEGSYIHLADGSRVIDAIASWWCKNLGHKHPLLKEALLKQADCFEHVIMANTTHAAIVSLSEKLSRLTNTLKRVMYASDGASAVEIALKMSVHAQSLKGYPERTQFIALENAYHGETGLALAVSDLGRFKTPYEPLLTKVHHLSPLPYLDNQNNPLWDNCEAYWPALKKQLDERADKTAALIVEPLVQGAAGMKIYSPDLLKRLRDYTQEKGIYLIADEIMTGLGRTGKMLACEYANIEADFLCLAKGLSAGFLPLSATLTSDPIYQLFYDDFSTGNGFFHSHTHSGNALACAVADMSLSILMKEKIAENVAKRSKGFAERFRAIAQSTEKLQNIRQIGFIVAGDLLGNRPRAAYQVAQKAQKLGALLRPIGNTLYWCPPLNCEEATLDELAKITKAAILETDLYSADASETPSVLHEV